jgi:hypothetical protein
MKGLLRSFLLVAGLAACTGGSAEPGSVDPGAQATASASEDEQATASSAPAQCSGALRARPWSTGCATERLGRFAPLDLEAGRAMGTTLTVGMDSHYSGR